MHHASAGRPATLSSGALRLLLLQDVRLPLRIILLLSWRLLVISWSYAGRARVRVQLAWDESSDTARINSNADMDLDDEKKKEVSIREIVRTLRPNVLQGTWSDQPTVQ